MSSWLNDAKGLVSVGVTTHPNYIYPPRFRIREGFPTPRQREPVYTLALNYYCQPDLRGTFTAIETFNYISGRELLPPEIRIARDSASASFSSKPTRRLRHARQTFHQFAFYRRHHVATSKLLAGVNRLIHIRK